MRIYRPLVGLLATLFLIFQVVTIAHAANYGEASHEHDGVTCVVSAVSQDEQDVLPVEPGIATDMGHTFAAYEISFKPTQYLTPPGRAPPPRSPPL